MDNSNNKSNSIETAGVAYGNVGVDETTYAMTKFNGARGHGFAAERAEHITDIYKGKDAQILGDDNAKNGADRLVNGVEIQSKYCQSGNKCIQECFENGKYRYYSKNGEPMQVEVPLDMYEKAVEAMERRIANGEVDGVTNPEDAKKLVKKGTYTYNQAKQIAKAGTIESLTFDAANGMIVARDAAGISAVISFATSIWNGDNFEEALQNAALSGLKVGGVSFLTTIISSQIARTTLSASVRVGADYLVKKMGPKASSYIANALSSGTNIYGAAAMNNVSKLLAGNIIANTISLILLSTGDIINLFRGRISGEQFLKYVTVTGATIAGGSAGWIAGSAVGAAAGGAIAGAATGGAATAVGAKVGAKVGGFIGSVAGGATAEHVTHGVMDEIIEDDSVKMMRIIEQEFVSICEENLLTENEVYAVLNALKEILTPKELKDMFASSNRHQYARNLLFQSVNPILNQRATIGYISEDDLLSGIRSLVEDAADGVGIFDDNYSPLSLTEIQTSLKANMNIREDQAMQIMQPVVQMNKTQMRAENTTRSMIRSDEKVAYELNDILNERDVLKAELNKLLEY